MNSKSFKNKFLKKNLLSVSYLYYTPTFPYFFLSNQTVIQ